MEDTSPTRCGSPRSAVQNLWCECKPRTHGDIARRRSIRDSHERGLQPGQIDDLGLTTGLHGKFKCLKS